MVVRPDERRTWPAASAFGLISLALACGPIRAELNQLGIHHLYLDGEFAQAIDAIQEFQDDQAEYSRSDSVFIAKYLAVMYSADPSTKEKGKYWMRRLLKFDPETRLYDMFISDGIKETFQWVRSEYFQEEEERKRKVPALAVPPPRPDSAPATNLADPISQAKPQEHRSLKGIWIASAVGGALLATGVAVILLLPDEESSRNYSLEKP